MSFPNQLAHLPSLLEVINRSPLTISPDLSVAAAIALMSQAEGRHCTLLIADAAAPVELGNLDRNSCVLVTAGTQLRGILTERDIVRLTANQTDLTNISVGEVMTRQLITLTQSPSQTALTALSLFYQHQIRHLPIVDEAGDLVGIVTPDLIRQILQPVNLLKLRSIDEVMTTQIIHAPSTTSVLSIAQQMATHRVSCVVITTETREELAGSPELQAIGMITERDIVQFQTLGIDFAQTQVQTVMSSPVVSLQPHDSMWHAQQEMQSRRIRRLVITGSSGQLLGIVTQTSLLQVLDPMEVLATIDILQHQVQVQTTTLEQTNQELRQAIERQQQTEAELRLANDRLEQLIAARTGELSQCDLQYQQAEGTLQDTLRSLEFQKYALDRSAIVVITDCAGVITYVNEQFCQMSKYSSAELVGQNHRIINSGYHRPEFFQTLWQTITQGEVWRGEICNRAKDGSLYWVATTIVPCLDEKTGELVRFEAKHFLADGSSITVDFSLSPIFDETGKVVMLIPEGRDISDRKAAEHLIIEQAMLLNIATDAIMVRDLNNRLLFWSNGAERIYGWSASEVIDRNALELLYPDPSPAVIAFDTVLRQGEWQGELEKVTKTGQIVVVQSRWTLVRDEENNPKEIL